MAPSTAVVREPGLDVLLITIDTLRADALGAYGNARAETPWMDRLAAGGVRFTGAHAHSVLTLPSHANIFSGLYPQEHGVRDNSGFRYPTELPTLAGVLREHGYRTGAFVSAFPLDSRFGLDRGFDTYDDSFVDATSRPAFFEQERSGTATVALAQGWLEAVPDRPSFAWVHLYEPHFPYAPPEPFATRHRDDPYLGDVAAADAALAPLLRPLLAAGDRGDTLVVLTSDHGEALGEHGEATHGIFAYEGVLAVPLILYQPRLCAPRLVRAPAGHVDLLPTILDVLSLPVPPGLRGRSLLPAAAGQSVDTAAPTYFEALSGQLNRGWAPLFGLVQEGWKYIDLPIPELYELNRDPSEGRNLATAEPQRLAAMRNTLEPLRALDEGAAPSPESAEIRERLQSLGYLSSGTPGARERYTEKDDPKRLIELDEIQRQVAGLYDEGDLEGALELGRRLVRRRPGMRMALLDLAHLERESGDLDAAIQTLRRAFALNPEDPAALALLATYLTQAGRLEEAVQLTEPHTDLAQPDIEVLLTRGLTLARQRRPREAFATFQRARDLDPSNPKVSVYLGTFFLMGGQRDEARAAFEEALAANPRAAQALSSLGIMAAEEGRPEAALEHWHAAVAADPREHAKLLVIGTRLWNGGQAGAARPLLELFVSSAPRQIHREEIARVRALLAGSSGD
jgi:tetratricopeptide (TPR) repeat protein